MKGKKQLEIYLQGLLQKEIFLNDLEQYPTDASNAAYILSLAYGDGNISGRSVVDLGTGNGIFACGAAALGAKSTVGIDVDADQIAVAKKNCGDGSTTFITGDVRSVSGHFDTAIMNAPFGSVNIHADLPFLEKAIEVADFVYSIHNRKSRDFVRSFYLANGHIFREEDMNLMVGRLYKHHTKDRSVIPATFFSVELSH